MTKYLLLSISVFCFLHIIRDYFQITRGYKLWYTRIGHFWHHPEYEVHGMVIFGIVGIITLYLALR